MPTDAPSETNGATLIGTRDALSLPAAGPVETTAVGTGDQRVTPAPAVSMSVSPTQPGRPANGSTVNSQTTGAELASPVAQSDELPNPDGYANSATRARLIAKYGPSLVIDVEDAQMLLSYLTRAGLQEDRKVTDETIQSVISARVRMQKEQFDCETEEAGFRKNFNLLARAAAPVSIVSLHDSLSKSRYYGGYMSQADGTSANSAPKKKWFWPRRPPWKDRHLFSIAEITCFEYRNYALMVLALLLVTQTYWTICFSLFSRLPPLDIDPSTTVVTAKGATEASPSSSPTDTGLPPTLYAGGTMSQADFAMTYLSVASKNANRSRIEALAFWVWPLLDESTKESIRSKRDVVIHPNTTTDVMVAARQVINVMQAWWLPLLYGALGSMVYVVRTLSLLARDRLFRREALVTLNLRIYLGMISGLAIGWFLKEIGPTANTVASVSPFALAFVAGYGVELFFALLDKVVSSFTGPDAAKP